MRIWLNADILVFLDESFLGEWREVPGLPHFQVLPKRAVLAKLIRSYPVGRWNVYQGTELELLGMLPEHLYLWYKTLSR